MYGDFQPMIGAANTQDLNIADRIDFIPNGTGSGSFRTGIATLDLAPFANASGGIIQDLLITPFASVSNFYSITVGAATLTFDLTALAIDTQTSNYLNMSGSGTLHLAGYDDTPGTWFFTGQSSGGTHPLATFSWSAGSLATPVPEPATLALLGLGLLAAGATRRMRKAA